MTKAEILNGKTRKELAAMIGIAYMNQFNNKRLVKRFWNGKGSNKTRND